MYFFVHFFIIFVRRQKRVNFIIDSISAASEFRVEVDANELSANYECLSLASNESASDRAISKVSPKIRVMQMNFQVTNEFLFNSNVVRNA